MPQTARNGLDDCFNPYGAFLNLYWGFPFVVRKMIPLSPEQLDPPSSL